MFACDENTGQTIVRAYDVHNLELQLVCTFAVFKFHVAIYLYNRIYLIYNQNGHSAIPIKHFINLYAPNTIFIFATLRTE